MKTLLAVGFATAYGIALRIMFGFLNSFMGIMSLSFLVLAPVLIGFLTIILIPKEQTKGPLGAFFKPWLTSLAILVLTMFLSIEGVICWIMIYPFFAVLAGIGGLMAFYLRRKSSDTPDKNDWDQPNTLNVSLILLIPAVVGFVEGDKTLASENLIISESVTIPASTKVVWKELTHINDIALKENQFSLSRLMGFPRHLQTTLDTIAIGGKRKAIYENGLYFDETISQFENGKRLVLDVKTDPDKIPPTVMDEHIVIGGKHIDILQDDYKLEEISADSCRLTLSSRFYINTPFNWYAGIWARYLMSDILKGELDLIRQRAQRK